MTAHPCPDHPGETAHNCRGCAADRKAAPAEEACQCGHERWQHPSDLGCLVASDPDGPWDDDCQQFREATGAAQWHAAADLPTRIARLARDCREHPWPLPKPSCPECARNAGIAAAARLARETTR